MMFDVWTDRIVQTKNPNEEEEKKGEENKFKLLCYSTINHFV
jgi:hypothetical protein